MLTENNLRCFISLAETLNFTRTAKQLYMSQQAVSQHIARLEEDLGFPLFVRTRHSVSLTKDGAQMFEFWSQVFRDFTALQEECRDRHSFHRDCLRIGYQDWINFGSAVNAALNSLESSHPDVMIESMRGNPDILLQRLKDRELNLVLMYERFVQNFDEINRLELLCTPITLMISPANPKVTPDATYKDFITDPFVFDAFPGEPSADALRRAKKEIAMYGLKPSKTIFVNSRDSAYTEAELGRGFVLSTGVSRISRSSDLRQYPIGVDEHIVCLWNEDEKNSLVAEYARYLKKAYGRVDNP